MPDQQQQQSSSSAALVTAQTDSNIQQLKRPPFLRRCSISDPHLDIVPHFMKEEKSFNPFNRMLSGLFEKGSNFSLDKSTESVEHAGAAAGHLFSPSLISERPGQEQLRQQFTKGNSAVELKNISSHIVDSNGLRKSASSASSLLSSSPQATHHFPAIPETEDQGLMMSARPGVSIPTNTSNSLPTTETASPPKSGFKSLFGTGYLSRPVLHSQEENYRILMALDR